MSSKFLIILQLLLACLIEYNNSEKKLTNHPDNRGEGFYGLNNLGKSVLS